MGHIGGIMVACKVGIGCLHETYVFFSLYGNSNRERVANFDFAIFSCFPHRTSKRQKGVYKLKKGVSFFERRF